MGGRLIEVSRSVNERTRLAAFKQFAFGFTAAQMGRSRMLAGRLLTAGVLLFGAVATISAQTQAAARAAAAVSTANSAGTHPGDASLNGGPLAELFDRVRTTTVDPAQVYRVDGLDIADEDLQMTLIHGTLGLFRRIDGEITGAVFEGRGEVLVMPPTVAERISLVNFTGEAILDQQFTTAYFRFTDGALHPHSADELEPIAGEDFASRWASPVLNLNAYQSLRVLAELLNHGRTPYFFARVAGTKLGAFDLLVDRSLPEQVVVSRASARDHRHFEDIWTSFPMRTARLGKPAPRGEDIRVRRYIVRTHILPDLMLEGQATVQFTGVTSGDRVAVFSLAPSLEIRSVKDQDGRSVPFFQNDEFHAGGSSSGHGIIHPGYMSDLVSVVLHDPVQEGRGYQLDFTYAGRILEDAGDGLYGIEDRATWYPRHGDEPALFDLSYTYPAGLTLVSTGDPVAPQAAGNAETKTTAIVGAREADERTSRYVTTRPLMLAGFNLGRYDKVEKQMGTADLQVYAAAGANAVSPGSAGAPNMLDNPTPPPPPLTHEQLEAIADDSAQVVAFYEKRYGRLPFDRLAITEMPYRFGQGWPGLLYLSHYSYLPADELDKLGLGADAEALYRFIMRPHEIAHEWWGDDVAWATYRDEWIPEGLANYSALMYLRSQPLGEAQFAAVLERYRQHLLRNGEGQTEDEDSAGPLTLGLRLNSSRFPNGYSTLIYDKGTWVFRMLHALLAAGPSTTRAEAGATPDSTGGGGDVAAPIEATDAFFAALRQFRRAYSGQAPNTADLQRVLQAYLPREADVTGDRKLDWFFREWVEGTGIPDYLLTNVVWHRPDRNGERRVTGTIVQNDVGDDFTMPVPLYVESGSQRILLGRVFTEGRRTSFTFETPSSGDLALDPDRTILRR
jgi:hypothetical protein